MKRPVMPPQYERETMDTLVRCLEMAFTPEAKNARSRNDAAISRFLAINVRTWIKVASGEDQWPWWPTVLTEAITHTLPHVNGLWRRTEISKLLRDLPEYYAKPIEQAFEARDWLIEQLSTGPAVSSELLKLGNRGTIPVASIRRAAKRLGVVMKRQGKGETHLTVWSLPSGFSID